MKIWFNSSGKKFVEIKTKQLSDGKMQFSKKSIETAVFSLQSHTHLTARVLSSMHYFRSPCAQSDIQTIFSLSFCDVILSEPGHYSSFQLAINTLRVCIITRLSQWAPSSVSVTLLLLFTILFFLWVLHDDLVVLKDQLTKLLGW